MTVLEKSLSRRTSTFADQTSPDHSFELEEEESGSSIARKQWSDNSILKPFQLTGDLSGFPDLHLGSILYCLPVSSASAERALSKLKIVKNHLRISVTDDMLAPLLLLAAESRI